MERNKNIMERMARKIDLMTEPIPGQPLVEIAGEHRVLIENHCGVTKYSSNEIMAKVSFGFYSICGSSLELLQMTKERLVIGGCICSVAIIGKE